MLYKDELLDFFQVSSYAWQTLYLLEALVTLVIKKVSLLWSLLQCRGLNELIDQSFFHLFLQYQEPNFLKIIQSVGSVSSSFCY